MATPPRPRSLRPTALRGARSHGGSAPWPPVADRAALVDCAIYRSGEREPGTPTWEQAYEDVRGRRSGFVWIGLHEPSFTELDGMAKRFGLHPLAVEDAVHAHQRPKLEQYDEMLFAVLKTVHYSDSDGAHGAADVVETGEVMVFLGADFVITVRHGEHGNLRSLRKKLERERTDLLQLGPSIVLHAIMDKVVDGYLAVAAALQEDVDDVEAAVFSGTRRTTDPNRMYVLKREVGALRRSAAPLTGPLKLLSERPVSFVNEDIREYFRDVNDHLTTVVEQVTGFDDLVTTLVAANLAQVSVRQNEDMRKISAWVAIAALPTMVAGIYGMNFEHMPELHWTFGYPLVLSLTVTACSLLFRSFKRNGWL